MGTACWIGCSTYRADLDRAASHYNDNEYEQALVLLEVLERDRDSLSEQEQARYTYFRGMTHFRMGQRRAARHWLGVASALEDDHQGGLSHEESARIDDVLTELNREVYGGSAEGPPKERCESDGDCGTGQFCDSGLCRQAQDGEKAGPAERPPEESRGSGRSCGADVSCPGDEVCIDGRCFKP